MQWGSKLRFRLRRPCSYILEVVSNLWFRLGLLANYISNPHAMGFEIAFSLKASLQLHFRSGFEIVFSLKASSQSCFRTPVESSFSFKASLKLHDQPPCNGVRKCVFAWGFLAFTLSKWARLCVFAQGDFGNLFSSSCPRGFKLRFASAKTWFPLRASRNLHFELAFNGVRECMFAYGILAITASKWRWPITKLWFSFRFGTKQIRAVTHRCSEMFVSLELLGISFELLSISFRQMRTALPTWALSWTLCASTKKIEVFCRGGGNKKSSKNQNQTAFKVVVNPQS